MRDKQIEFKFKWFYVTFISWVIKNIDPPSEATGRSEQHDATKAKM